MCNYHVRVMFKKLTETATAPSQAGTCSAGFDLYADRIEDCGHYLKIHTGIAIEPEDGCWFMLVPRSSTHKKGMTLYNNVGVLDQDFRGEIVALLLKTEGFVMPVIGDRLVQIVPMQQIRTQFVEVTQLGDTSRGTGGFGSTGK